MSGPIPLAALTAFVEAGRRGSMKAAAAALGVTPGAVSQQVKRIEQRLGASLFERHNREIRLTVAGQRLLDQVADGFARIEAAWEGLEGEGLERQRRRPATLTVTTPASFAASWLVPRLGRFTARHPEIEVRVETTSRLVDLRREPVDLALRHGLGSYPGLVATHFLDLRILPIASPGLLAKGPPIREPRDCLAYPLLQDSDRADWRLWLRSHGIEDRRAGRGPSFEDDILLIQAALAGQGIALVRELYGREEIASGRLQRVLDLPLPTRFAYYIVTRPDAAQQRKVAAFRDWLLTEAAA
jgi:LysR family glycine cleavage system transcriptional activator